MKNYSAIRLIAFVESKVIKRSVFSADHTLMRTNGTLFGVYFTEPHKTDSDLIYKT